ncbi:E3 ubiquitin-protein ligase MPSR1-like [Solanum stenotomum]|uniref:E3 ubiquitin-protein ligase MPSR1-like n=1 Tax=Solanum stenotomum TaxID=172797 RepID=UPI0020D157ED|nr:E3 ubiquitin-protein ligase MPSR1-like [Solanum stenotomum]
MARFHALRDALSQAEQHERSRIQRQQNIREVVPTAVPTATNWEPIIRTTSTVPPPATKASIEKLPDVEIVQEEEEEQMSECAICLVEFQVKETAKEMPCKHRYHSNCINRWLEIHASCPICRYKMP